MNLRKLADASISQKRRERREALSALRGNSKNIRTFAILTAQNPDSVSSEGSFNKKVNRSLLNELKSTYYKYIPVEGHFAGNKKSSYMVFNIPFTQAKSLAGKYHKTSFCFCDMSNGEVEYWEKSDENLPFDSLKNPYVKKDGVSFIEELDEADDNYTLIGKNFKFTFPFSLFSEISDNIQKRLDTVFHGDERIIDFCLEHVGYSVYIRKKSLYNF